MKKVRVLHFTIANTGSGVTQFILNLWKNIDKSRFHFDFVTMSQKLDYADELEAQGCRIYYVTTYAETDKEQFEKEIESILDNGYDVVHLHTSWWRGFALEEIAKKRGISKIIIHSHNTDVHIKEDQSRKEARKLHEEQKKLLSEDMATDFLACSQKAAEWLYGGQIPEERIQIIPNGINVEEYQYNPFIRKEYREKMNLQNSFVIGHVGRFAYQKNHEFLVDVFADIVKEYANVKLLLVGIGELESQIKDRAVRLGISENIIFAGKRNDVNKLMQAMDLFVLPSRFEGLGIVLIEAQAAGLKCLVSDTVPEEAKVLDDFEFISLIKEEWKQAVFKSMKAKKNRTDTSKLLIAAGYDIGDQVKRLEKIYQENGNAYSFFSE